MTDENHDSELMPFAAIIRNGEVVAFPTETVYGLGADAWNADAVARIFTIKGRPPDNPLIVHVSSMAMAETLVTGISDDARRLMERFWPGPLAIIFQKRPEVPDIVTAGLPTVAVRMPDHPIALQLISASGPIAAPSANPSGRPSPTRAEHVRQDFGDDLPVIDGGPCRFGLESTVLDLSVSPYTILRPGHITQQKLKEVLQKQVRVSGFQSGASADRDDQGGFGGRDEQGDRIGHGDQEDRRNQTAPGVPAGSTPRSPGMKYTHYAPDARVRWMNEEECRSTDSLRHKQPANRTLYLLHRERNTGASGAPTDFGDDPGRGYWGDQKSLENQKGQGAQENQPYQIIPYKVIDYKGDYTDMARDLYDRFRMADLKGFDEIAIEPFAERDNATLALLNRIEKAIGR